MRVVRSVREREPRTSRRCRNRVRLFQIKEAEWTALDEISPEPEGLLLTSAEPGAGLSALEDSMPASWAFLFWLLDALVEDFISPEAPHRRRPRSLSGLVRLAGAPSKMDPAFEKINLAGSAQRQQNPGFVEPSRGDVEKGSVSRPLFPRERRREAAGRSRRALREAQPADVRGFAPESHRPS